MLKNLNPTLPFLRLWGIALLAVLITLLQGFTNTAYAQGPVLQGINPISNTITAPLTTMILITYSQAMSASTVSSQTFAIHGMQSGLVTETHGVINDNTLIVNPTHAFHQGELVYAIATTQATNIAGTAPLSATQWQFNAGVVSNRCVAGFSQQSTALTNVPSGRVAWGDYDNDGNLDILLTGGFNPVTEVWHNDSGGSFSLQSTNPTDLHNGGRVAWGDYDNDGDLDILLAGSDSSFNRVTEVWRNDGGGSFSAAITNTITGVSGGSVTWGDYDNDGNLDILLTGYTGSTEVTEVWRNDGGGNFSLQSTDSTAVSGGSATWGDYDNDGDLDILLTGYTGSTEVTEVWRNDGRGSFSAAITNTITGVSGSSVAWGDYDNDGNLDILLAGYTGSTNVTEVWRNDGGGSFSQQSAAPTGVRYTSVAWGDYDNDGDLDIVLAGNDSPFNFVTEVWRNDGGGSFSLQSTDPTDVYNGSVAWGDYDNDGDLDILLAGNDSTVSSNQVTKLWRNDDCPSDLNLVKRVNPSSAASGETITYTIVFTNDGLGATTGVVLTDIIPTEMTNLSYQSSYLITSTGSQSYTWNVDRLAPNEGGVITITGYLIAGLSVGQTLTNTATITTSNDADSSNNSSGDIIITINSVTLSVYLPIILK